MTVNHSCILGDGQEVEVFYHTFPRLWCTFSQLLKRKRFRCFHFKTDPKESHMELCSWYRPFPLPSSCCSPLHALQSLSWSLEDAEDCSSRGKSAENAESLLSKQKHGSRQPHLCNILLHLSAGQLGLQQIRILVYGAFYRDLYDKPVRNAAVHLLPGTNGQEHISPILREL